MVADQLFYTVSGDDETHPTTPDFLLDPKKITWVGVEDLNGTFYPLIEGINPLVYTQESQNGLPYSYEIRQAIEVFPTPDAAYLLQIKGRPLNFRLTADADILTIDPELVFLLALANAKAHYQQADAQLYFTQATSYLGTLNAGTFGTARFVPGTIDAPPAPKPVLLPIP